MGITRQELLSTLGVIKEGPDLVKFNLAAYKALEAEIWKAKNTRYRTSFAASNFPVEEKSCGRQAIYDIMNLPAAEPFSPHGRAITLIGVAVEEQIVYRWGHSGYTIAGSVPLSPSKPYEQLALKDEETWMSGRLDAVLYLPGFNYVLPVDVKSKATDIIESMKVGTRDYDKKHWAQVQAYIYLCNLVHEDMGWKAMGLAPAKSAIIFYADRANPINTHEFYVPADWETINAAVSRLRQFRQDFNSGTLPGRDSSWKWTEEPCRWCNFKKYACKPDWKQGVQKISESGAIEWGNSIKPYSFPSVRKAIMRRWKQ